MAFLTLLIERASDDDAITHAIYLPLLYLHEQTRDEVINFIFWHTNGRARERARATTQLADGDGVA